MRVMVAIDDSDESFYALEWVLANPFSRLMTAPPPPAAAAGHDSGSSLLTLVHVQQPFQPYGFPAASAGVSGCRPPPSKPAGPVIFPPLFLYSKIHLDQVPWISLGETALPLGFLVNGNADSVVLDTINRRREGVVPLTSSSPTPTDRPTNSHHLFYPTSTVVDSVRKSQEEISAALLSRALNMCRNKMIKAETLILEGDPKDKICEISEEMNVDLLVVGSRGLGKIKRAFLGSVSDYCAHHAKCPTLIVKPPPKEASSNK
ncbi:Universal stress protein A [Corchorus olitorius]|uniref:Universal stress protein A n=1 Tax=Corchorus olitorius TaxID=93759 RepID=A0A1R3HEI2_9ROSI|nr:Universal stress protein A [Corchorus olitorius]